MRNHRHHLCRGPMAVMCLVLAALAYVGCGGGGGGDSGGSDAKGAGDTGGGGGGGTEFLTPEPAGAPTEPQDGLMACLGTNYGAPLQGQSLELTGYVRTLADPEATSQTPAAKVTAYSNDGVELGSGFADPAKAGRVAFTVPVPPEGFTGYAVVQQEGYLDWRFRSSRAVTDTSLSGWAWLTTPDEAQQRAGALGITLDQGKGILVGAVHDCDGLGISNAVVTVDGSTEGVYYIEGFDISDSRTFTSPSGRFAVANLAPGPVTVEAWARLEQGGPLVLLSRVQATIEAGVMTAVDLQPRTGP